MQISQMAVEIGNLARHDKPSVWFEQIFHDFPFRGETGLLLTPVTPRVPIRNASWPPGMPRKPFAANSSWRCGPMMMPASPSRVAVPCRFGGHGWSWGGHFFWPWEVWEDMASSVDVHDPKKKRSLASSHRRCSAWSKHRVTQIPMVDHSILVRPLEWSLRWSKEYQSYQSQTFASKIYLWILQTFKLVILRLSKPFLNQPLIQGYYGPLYTDVESETEAARPSYREYFIIFEPQAGRFHGEARWG